MGFVTWIVRVFTFVCCPAKNEMPKENEWRKNCLVQYSKSTRSHTHERITFNFAVCLRFYKPLTENVVDKWRIFVSVDILDWCHGVAAAHVYIWVNEKKNTQTKLNEMKSCFFFVVHMRDG